MNDFVNVVKEGLKILNISINDNVPRILLQYHEFMVEWNKKANLTRITDPIESAEKHFIDSLICLKFLEGNKDIIDVGTGAGFPGMPVYLALPVGKMVLLDSVKKKIDFLKDWIQYKELNNIEVIHGRAEDIGRKKCYRESFDYVLSRAVAQVNILVEYCIPFIKKGGLFICQKGPYYKDEVKSAEGAIKMLGGDIIDIVQFNLPFSNVGRTIILIKKISETPDKYPRKAGLPEKKPLTL